MPKGKKFEHSEEEVKEVLYESGGNIAVSCNLLGCCPRKLYDFIDEYNLSEYVDSVRHTDARLRDDIALTALDKLMAAIKSEPAVALKAAHLTLTRKGGTRKDWVPKETTTGTISLPDLLEALKKGGVEVSQQ